METFKIQHPTKIKQDSKNISAIIESHKMVNDASAAEIMKSLGEPRSLRLARQKVSSLGRTISSWTTAMLTGPFPSSHPTCL